MGLVASRITLVRLALAPVGAGPVVSGLWSEKGGGEYGGDLASRWCFLRRSSQLILG